MFPLPNQHLPAVFNAGRWDTLLRMKGNLTGAEACFEEVLHIGYKTGQSLDDHHRLR